MARLQSFTTIQGLDAWVASWWYNLDLASLIIKKEETELSDKMGRSSLGIFSAQARP